MYINNLGHMTKMAAMPIYGKNPSKIIFSETNRLISRKLGVRHRWLKYSNVYINHDPVMILTKFMARSTWVACASELGKLLKCHLKEKANRKLANGQNIEDSEKRKWPKGLSAPALELNTIIFKHVYWYMQLISGERLQDHWSSGCIIQLFHVKICRNCPNFTKNHAPTITFMRKMMLANSVLKNAALGTNFSIIMTPQYNIKSNASYVMMSSFARELVRSIN